MGDVISSFLTPSPSTHNSLLAISFPFVHCAYSLAFVSHIPFPNKKRTSFAITNLATKNNINKGSTTNKRSLSSLTPPARPFPRLFVSSTYPSDPPLGYSGTHYSFLSTQK